MGESECNAVQYNTPKHKPLLRKLGRGQHLRNQKLQVTKTPDDQAKTSLPRGLGRDHY